MIRSGPHARCVPARLAGRTGAKLTDAQALREVRDRAAVRGRAVTGMGASDNGATIALVDTSALVQYLMCVRPRAEVVSALVRRRNIGVHGLDKDNVIQGLLVCAPSARVSFADAMLSAMARSAGVEHRSPHSTPVSRGTGIGV